MSGCDAVQNIGFKHRVERHAGEMNVVTGEYMCVVLEVMADLLRGRVLKERLHRAQHVVTRQLFRSARIIMCDRDIRRRTAFC